MHGRHFCISTSRQVTGVRRNVRINILMSLSAPTVETPEKPSQEAKSRRTKVGFVSLGCPKNLVDSEVMMGLLVASGAEITSRADQADVIVVNTCSFIESAQQ